MTEFRTAVLAAAWLLTAGAYAASGVFETDDPEFRRMFILVDVETAFNEGVAILAGPRCGNCTEEKKRQLYDSLVQGRLAHTQRLEDAGYGVPGSQFGSGLASSAADIAVASAAHVAAMSLSGGGYCPTPCNMRRAACHYILLGMETTCKGRAENDVEHKICVIGATASLQTCLTRKRDGETEEARQQRCQTAYDETIRGPCTDRYEEAFNNCIGEHIKRYEICAGDCLNTP